MAIDSKNAEFDRSSGHMRVRREAKVAKIIDGQHRLAGLEGFEGSFDLNLTIFIDMELEDQALLFATINLEQTRVSKSLAYDLFEYATRRSPQNTAHNIAKLLNGRDGSPFERRIKILGVATGVPTETLTQAAFVDRLLPYLSDAPMRDRDQLRRGRVLQGVHGADELRLIFRNMFIDERDPDIARVLWNYFLAVAERWPDAWWGRRPGNILNRTNGFGGLMAFLRDAYNSFGKPGKVVSQENFAGLFARIGLGSAAFTTERYLPGSSGAAQLYRNLLETSGLS